MRMLVLVSFMGCLSTAVLTLIDESFRVVTSPLLSFISNNYIAKKREGFTNCTYSNGL